MALSSLPNKSPLKVKIDSRQITRTREKLRQMKSMMKALEERVVSLERVEKKLRK